jgi:hypothetical protein
MSPRLSIFFLFLISLTAHAQWMVYDVRIQPDETASVNFNAYTGVYLVIPVEGGPTSMVFATERAGRVYAVSKEAGRYFIAANPQKRRGVFSSAVVNGTVHAMYQASGLLNGTLSYLANGERRAGMIPLSLNGTFMASDSEVDLEVPAEGDIGVVGVAALSATFRADLTRIIQDQKDQSADASLKVISDLLEKYGYQPDTEPLPGSDPEALEAAAPVPAPAPGPQPDTPVNDNATNGTLFPPGSKEEMERSLR